MATIYLWTRIFVLVVLNRIRNRNRVNGIVYLILIWRRIVARTQLFGNGISWSTILLIVWIILLSWSLTVINDMLLNNILNNDHLRTINIWLAVIRILSIIWLILLIHYRLALRSSNILWRLSLNRLLVLRTLSIVGSYSIRIVLVILLLIVIHFKYNKL